MDELVDLDALASARLETAPFEWAFIQRALRPAAAAQLRATFPEHGFWHLRRNDGEKDMDYRIRALVPLGTERVVDAGGLAPVWRRFAAELLSPAYRAASERALGRSLAGAPLEISAWRWGPGAELGAHADIPRKIASQVFYFNDGWDPAWGGTLRILGSKDVADTVAELPPTLGSASIIVRSDSSWHAVPRVRGDAAEPRLSVIATWQQPGSESPFWTVERDGSVRCHARGSAPA